MFWGIANLSVGLYNIYLPEKSAKYKSEYTRIVGATRGRADNICKFSK